jgi:ubiquinone/menaquinone biosynthesis C-methylase UbiE
MRNIDPATVEGFGEEWTRFDQEALSAEEQERLFNAYFRIFPWDDLREGAIGFDLGVGSGRWAVRVAPRVGRLDCVDPAEGALAVARRTLAGQANVFFHLAAVDQMPFAEGSMDFGYSLGVLHHVPDTQAGLKACARCLKPGAPFLVYLYYALENRPGWYRGLWKLSDVLRRAISRQPSNVRQVVADTLALSVYWPLARSAALGERAGLKIQGWPLAYYRRASFYTMRTDALDRFGTRLETRFTREQIAAMMEKAGLERLRFSDRPPFWVAIGYRVVTPASSDEVGGREIRSK